MGQQEVSSSHVSGAPSVLYASYITRVITYFPPNVYFFSLLDLLSLSPTGYTPLSSRFSGSARTQTARPMTAREEIRAQDKKNKSEMTPPTSIIHDAEPRVLFFSTPSMPT